MKRILFLISLGSTCAFAQVSATANGGFNQAGGPVVSASTIAAFRTSPGTPVQGAPYSATITNESVQTLADGNRIVQTSTGTTARDSQGRTRQDAPLPMIGNLSAASAPHLVIIQDPAAQVAYTLNLTDKTAQKMPMPPAGALGPGPASAGEGNRFFIHVEGGAPPPGPSPPPPMAVQEFFVGDDSADVTTENLGSQTMEGVIANGTRTTHTIPAGQIGNDRAISIVTEVWTSPDLKTIVYSKRSDPRMGDQTFQLTNIVRAEPDPSLFTVPLDFKTVDGPQPILYRSNQ